METEEVEINKIEKVKKHFKENKSKYIGGSVIFVTGMIVGVFVFTRKPVTQEEYNDGFMQYIQNRIKMRAKTAVNCNNTYQTISMYGHKIGRPGIPVIDKTTGKRFESMTLAAQSIGATASEIHKHLNGLTDYVRGHEFEFAE